MVQCQEEFLSEMRVIELHLAEVWKDKSEQKSEIVQDAETVEINPETKEKVEVTENKGSKNEQNVESEPPKADENVSVNDVNVKSNESLIGLFQTLALPKTKVKQYEGDPLYYHAFISGFNNMVTNVPDYVLKLNTLLSYCSGKALESIQFCVLKPPKEGYEAACKTLKEKFGNTGVIVQAWVSKITDRPKIEVNALKQYAEDLDNCFQTLKELGYLNELNNQSSLKLIIEKLPRFLRNRWQKENYRLKLKSENATLEDVVKFIRTCALEVNDPVFGFSEIRQPTHTTNVRKVQVNNLNWNADRERSPKCW
ncbi:uncharacterized protein LOC117101376, partial [Anneissia japonica]|uniref:uncharacterized protein LOC117101376 n=1 Tax=Anneissia japonica TaxID=1529436 RepID=UPI001425904B